jgi:hypothetical protein
MTGREMPPVPGTSRPVDGSIPRSSLTSPRPGRPIVWRQELSLPEHAVSARLCAHRWLSKTYAHISPVDRRLLTRQRGGPVDYTAAIGWVTVTLCYLVCFVCREETPPIRAPERATRGLRWKRAASGTPRTAPRRCVVTVDGAVAEPARQTRLGNPPVHRSLDHATRPAARKVRHSMARDAEQCLHNKTLVMIRPC